jgi:hypothetical protein
MEKDVALKMFGCDPDTYLDSVKNSATYQLSGASMVVAGLMSDAQEEIASGMDERARQTLNLAKMILFEIMDGKLLGVVPRFEAA